MGQDRRRLPHPFAFGPGIGLVHADDLGQIHPGEARKGSRLGHGGIGVERVLPISEYLDYQLAQSVKDAWQEKAKKKLAVAVYNHYKRIFSPPPAGEVELEKSNILLIGPTGTGKTLLCETLARVLELPFVTADATSLAQSRYVNEEIQAILERLGLDPLRRWALRGVAGDGSGAGRRGPRGGDAGARLAHHGGGAGQLARAGRGGPRTVRASRQGARDHARGPGSVCGD